LHAASLLLLALRALLPIHAGERSPPRQPSLAPDTHAGRNGANGSSNSGSSNGAHNSGGLDASDEDSVWRTLAFPSYLQSRQQHRPEVCRDFAQAVSAAERRQQRRNELGVSQASAEESVEEEEEEQEYLEAETVWHTIRCVREGR
jgi:hypothetical protein